MTGMVMRAGIDAGSRRPGRARARQPRPAGLALAGLIALGALTTATGCGGAEEPAVRQVADDFWRALADRDGRRGCALLAPATRTELEQSAGLPCAEAILEEDLPVPDGGEVVVFDNAGRVSYDGETLFLSEFPEGWRIAAAGCTARDERPFDCAVSGG